MRFGGLISVPQGVTDAYRALYPSISKTDNIRCVLIGDGGVAAAVIGLGRVSATITGVGTLTPDSEMGATLSVTITGSGSMQGTVRGVGRMGAVIDAGARPSAFDIAQEVWQSQKSAYNAPGTMGNALNNASTGGVDYNALATAVWNYLDRTITENPGITTAEIVAALEATAIPVNVKQVNDIPIDGAGTSGDPWGPA